MMSSDQQSRASAAIGPDGNQSQMTKKRSCEPKEFSVGDRPNTMGSDGMSKQMKCMKYARLALALVAIVLLTFCVCLDAYFAFTSADEGLAFIVTCLIAALIFDLVLQIVLTVALSAAQYYCEIRNREPFFNTDKLMRLTEQAREIANQIYFQYEDQAALLKV